MQAGPTRRRTRSCVCKHLRGSLDQVLRNAGASRRVVEVEATDRFVQLGHPAHELFDVLVVLEPAVEDHLDHRGEQRRVLARLHLQMKVGLARDVRAAWVDDDHLHPTLASRIQPPGRIRLRHIKLVGSGRVRADEHHTIGALHVEQIDRNRSAKESIARNGQARRIDRVGRVHLVRPERTEPTLHEPGSARGCPMSATARVHRDRVRAIAFYDLAQSFRDLVEGL